MQIVKQDGKKDCGVAALLSIVKYYGGDNTLENLRELSKTTKKGVSAYNLIEAAKLLGFESYGLSGEITSITDDLLPIISHIIVNKSYQHFVVIYKINHTTKKVLIMDPAQGKKILSFSQFNLLTSRNYIYLKPKKKISIIKQKKILNHKFKDFLLSNKTLSIYIMIFSLVILLFNIISSLHLKIILSNAIDPQIIQNVYSLSLFIVIVYIYKELISFIKNILLLKWQTKLDEKLTGFIFEKLMYLPYSYYKNRTTGEVVARIQDLNTIKNFLTQILTTITTDFTCIFWFIIVLFSINSEISVIISLFTAFIVLTELVNQRMIKIPLYKYYMKEDQLNNIIMENISVNSIHTIKNNHTEKQTKNQFNKIHKNYLEKSYKVSLLIMIKRYIDNNLKNLFYTIFIMFSAIKIIENDFSLARLLIYQNILGYYLDSLLRLLEVIKNYENFNISKKRIEELLNINQENFIYSKYFKSYKLDGSIVFHNLTYKKEDKKIFNKINCTILNKEKVFLMGNSGSGKTTLMKMLLRYVNVDSNMISINGIDINHYHLNNIRENITYISQQETLYTRTIKENITLGKDINDNILKKVYKITDAEKIINRSKLKDMEIIEENGANYSGGEKQRIILARSLLRESDIYIFDEALSHIDIETANKILENIFKYLKNKTVIVISHRKPNYNLYNKILKLENGTLYEEKI